MTYRVRLQLPGNRVGEKTTTESQAVANYAFCDLLHRYAGQPVAATMTKRLPGANKSENLGFIDLTHALSRNCERCDYSGAFIDDGETCPNCRLVQ